MGHLSDQVKSVTLKEWNALIREMRRNMLSVERLNDQLTVLQRQVDHLARNLIMGGKN